MHALTIDPLKSNTRFPPPPPYRGTRYTSRNVDSRTLIQ